MFNPKFTRQTLLLKIRDQYDDDAWNEFIDLYRPYIYRIIQKMNVSPADRDDILQEIMLIAWKKLPEFEYDPSKGKFRSWLILITKRSVSRFINKKDRSAYFEDSSFNDDLKNGVSAEVEEMSRVEWQDHIASMAWKNIEKKFEPHVIEAFKRLASGEKGEVVSKEMQLAQNSVYVYKKRVTAALQKEIAWLDQELN